MRFLAPAALLALAPLALPATGQDLYVDVGAQAGTPSSAYAAADVWLPLGAPPVVWNTVPADATAVPLVDRNGNPTGVSITIAGGNAYAFDHPGTAGDDQALLDDGSQSAGTQTITLHGLDSAGCGYDLAYVLGSSPTETTRVRFKYVSEVELDGGGGWSGSHARDESYVLHEGELCCDFATGLDLVIEVEPAPGSAVATLTGLQLTSGPPAICVSGSFCRDDDGSLEACPCGPGRPQTGCDAPIPAMQGGGLTGGVLLEFVGQRFVPANRSTFRATGFPPLSAPGGVLFRGTGIDPLSPVVFGDGVRCVDATGLVRLGATVATGGTTEITFGHSSMAGSGGFYYQLWFRSTPASYCDPSAAFNTSNGLSLAW